MVSLPKTWSLSRHGRRGPRYSRGRNAADGDDQLSYLFSDGEDTSLHEINFDDATELRLRGGAPRDSGDRPRKQSPPVFEHKIVEGETLQGLALRYGCSVGTLRHLNNLLSDQDFFALVVLKVPVRVNVVTGKLVEPLSLDEEELVTSDGAESPPDKAIRYWSQLNQKVQAVIQQGSGDGSVVLGDVENGTSSSPLEPVKPSPVPQSTWSGADCGIGWCGILICVVTIAILVPLLYILFVLVSDKKFYNILH